jgi:hypothetical protein
MHISEEDKTIIDILKEEKRLLVQGELQLIQTSKQTIALLIPLLGVTLELASKIPMAYLFLPFLICAFGFFILSNQNTFNIACGYMDRIDKEIVKKAKMDFPLYQMSAGNAMAEWKFNISKQFGYFMPHPYYLLGIASAAVVLPIYGFSIIEGRLFLYQNHYYWYDVGFVIASIFALVVLVYSGVMYQQKFKDFRQQTIEKMFNELASKKSQDNTVAKH